MQNTVVAIVGPTCSGKTSLSIELALKLGGEVIACDSRNIYKYMDIGTAKPTKEEMKDIRHHLLDVAEPDQVFTVADYKRLGREAIKDILSRKKVPIICGGTGFYSRALLEGLSMPEVAPNEALRKELNELADQKGNAFLYQRLKTKDPIAAEKIMENDRFRVVRALEVMDSLAIPFSKAIKKEPVPFEVIWIGLTYENRDILKERIKERLNIQIDDGLEKEVLNLYKKYGKTRSLLNAVTYKQFIAYFEKELSYEEAIEECVKHNYQLARKQIMWFRSNPSMNWLCVDKSDNKIERVLKIIEKKV